MAGRILPVDQSPIGEFYGSDVGEWFQLKIYGKIGGLASRFGLTRPAFAITENPLPCTKCRHPILFRFVAETFQFIGEGSKKGTPVRGRRCRSCRQNRASMRMSTLLFSFPRGKPLRMAPAPVLSKGFNVAGGNNHIGFRQFLGHYGIAVPQADDRFGMLHKTDEIDFATLPRFLVFVSLEPASPFDQQLLNGEMDGLLSGRIAICWNHREWEFHLRKKCCHRHSIVSFCSPFPATR